MILVLLCIDNPDHGKFGTWVNGEKMTPGESKTIKDGDVLKLATKVNIR